MKHYANILHVALLATLLLAGCRSAAQHSTVSHHQQTDSLSEQLSSHAYGSLSEQVQNHTDTHGNNWKITWRFDTSQPVDSATGLPPTQSLEIEGCEIQQKHDFSKDVQAELVDSLQTSRHQMKEEHTDITVNDKRNIDAGTDIGKGLVLICVITAIIALVVVIYKLVKNAG